MTFTPVPLSSMGQKTGREDSDDSLLVALRRAHIVDHPLPPLSLKSCPFCEGASFVMVCAGTSAICQGCGAILPGAWVSRE